MAQPPERIQDALSDRQSPAEREKIVRRLPPDSGLDAIGVRMKEVFDTAKEWTDLDLSHIPDLLASPWYEMRMVGVSVLDFKARRRGLDDDGRRRLYESYMNHHEFINIWDLVDRSAPRVVGWYLLDKSRQPLFDLARSDAAIERRTAITASFWLIRQGDLDDPLALADLLLDDPSELVTKPVGTALREVGKIDRQRLLGFLARHRHRMSRPTLRLATYLLPDDIERSLREQTRSQPGSGTGPMPR
ncbi:DNA alkylation repair protein [Nocardiopsis alborubida]|uniref:DNA alkylation repair protein n=1 Tax=Nocardiopsis alborubida TaxID=146802 RepID=A0A7X6RNT9_9ACTN|nr:DNA alkylation repair protein [Nocardiopsis alborubida]NKY97044.1 DNA alkylation repair protein [Nocardiopsis alborubida]